MTEMRGGKENRRRRREETDWERNVKEEGQGGESVDGIARRGI